MCCLFQVSQYRMQYFWQVLIIILFSCVLTANFKDSKAWIQCSCFYFCTLPFYGTISLRWICNQPTVVFYILYVFPVMINKNFMLHSELLDVLEYAHFDFVRVIFASNGLKLKQIFLFIFLWITCVYWEDVRFKIKTEKVSTPLMTEVTFLLCCTEWQLDVIQWFLFIQGITYMVGC